MKELIKVGMANLKVSRSPNVLTTLGLGSCIGVALYDPVKKIGGLSHVMLPDIMAVKVRTNRAKFVNTSIEEMLIEMERLGASRTRVKAKLIGGAHMFEFAKPGLLFDVGKRNVDMAREELKKRKIRIVSEDVGEDFGRSVELELETGVVKIRTIAHGEKEI